MEGKTILLIDDDRTLAEMYRERLKFDGYNVIAVGTGEEGLEVAASQAPNLIMLDIMMPGIGGWETLKRLKDNPMTAGIPVIVITALVQDAIKQKARQFGAVESFVKSEITPAEVMETIATVLDKAHSRGYGGAYKNTSG